MLLIRSWLARITSAGVFNAAYSTCKFNKLEIICKLFLRGDAFRAAVLRVLSDVLLRAVQMDSSFLYFLIDMHRLI